MDGFVTVFQSDGRDVQNSGGLSPRIRENIVPSIMHLEIHDIVLLGTFVSIQTTQMSESQFQTSR